MGTAMGPTSSSVHLGRSMHILKRSAVVVTLSIFLTSCGQRSVVSTNAGASNSSNTDVSTTVASSKPSLIPDVREDVLANSFITVRMPTAAEESGAIDKSGAISRRQVVRQGSNPAVSFPIGASLLMVSTPKVPTPFLAWVISYRPGTPMFVGGPVQGAAQRPISVPTTFDFDIVDAKTGDWIETIQG